MFVGCCKIFAKVGRIDLQGLKIVIFGCSDLQCVSACAKQTAAKVIFKADNLQSFKKSIE